MTPSTENLTNTKIVSTIQIPHILDSESLLECISKLIAQYKETTYQRCNEQHAASCGRGSTSSINVATGTESVPPATERRSAAQAAAAGVRREPAAAYAGKELTNVVMRRQPPSYAEVVSNSGDRDKATRFPTGEDPAAPEPVEKSSSYREESNFLSDLKYHEKKALNKLKTKLEANILKNSIFTKKEFPKKETAAAAVPEEKKPSEETCEKKEESEVCEAETKKPAAEKAPAEKKALAERTARRPKAAAEVDC
ncbi:hypothetical protein SASPL_151143 [Salvia splendens]|uniref:Uncharacterized protein n=1 Tax=Salvia splendens TaxID=180675 RepID=A0A8X8W7B8_SALSN|nr:hypothetical protein SASPL_151143 [Salvia splendens]